MKGAFGKNFNFVAKKIESCDLNIDCTDLIAFDYFINTNHLETVEGKIALVSFNSTVINTDLVSKLQGYSTSRMRRILTWMQVAAKEEPSMILSIMQNHYGETIKFIW